MRCLVTGAAGFVGSRLSRRLLDEGYTVRGVDCFTDYYDRRIKERNIAQLSGDPSFTLMEEDLVDNPVELIRDVDLVFHQAAQAGVRASWGREFAHYTHHNILATQRLLEVSRDAGLKRFVYASSSSVYGDAASLPMREDDLPRPISPYGVSKLAAEHLCILYHHNFGVPTVSLRYFTVYGPGQRPDMAFHRFLRAVLGGEELVIYGTGEQTRDFTYIDDIVEANLAAARAEAAVGKVYNIGGGSRITVNGVIGLISEVTGMPVKVQYQPLQAGDPPHTYADTARAAADLEYSPRTRIEEGLSAQAAYLKDLLNEGM